MSEQGKLSVRGIRKTSVRKMSGTDFGHWSGETVLKIAESRGTSEAQVFHALSYFFAVAPLNSPALPSPFRTLDGDSGEDTWFLMVQAPVACYSGFGEVAMTMTPELKRAIEMAGGQPVRVEDPETHRAYVVIEEDLYRKLKDAIPETDFTLHEFEELITLE